MFNRRAVTPIRYVEFRYIEEYGPLGPNDKE
jgi:hypothetical protein